MLATFTILISLDSVPSVSVSAITLSVDSPCAWVNTSPYGLVNLARCAVMNHTSTRNDTIVSPNRTLMLFYEGNVVYVTVTYLLQLVNSVILELYPHLAMCLCCSSEERTQGTRPNIVWKIYNEKEKRFDQVAVLELKVPHALQSAEWQKAWYPSRDAANTAANDVWRAMGSCSYFDGNAELLVRQARKYSCHGTPDIALFDWLSMFVANFA